MNTPAIDAIVKRFNDLPWHDSKLLSLSFFRRDREDLVRISVQLSGQAGQQAPVDLLFRESTILELEVDLGAKRVCADDISGALCYASSDWIKSLSSRSPRDSFATYLHFEIELIPPGGLINILAKDFMLELSK